MRGERERRLLHRDSPVPLYVQIARRLRTDLASQPVSDGPLFTEEELGRRFGVHRLTVRQALRELERDGLITRRRGLGTFRAPHKLRGEPLYIESFLDHWAMQGRAVRSEVLEMAEEPAEGRVAATLGLLDGGPVMHVLRRRFVDDQPLVLDHIFLPASAGRGLRPEDLVERTLHRAIRLRTGRTATEANLEIEATTARDEEAELLGVTVGSPLFLRRIVLVDALREPLSYGWSLYRADLYTYTLTVPLPEERAYGQESQEDPS